MYYDYTSVTPQTVSDDVENAIAAGERLITAITGYHGDREWASTLAPLDGLAELAARAYGTGPFMARVHPDKAVRDAASDAEERLSKWLSDLPFRRDLYEAVEAYATTEEAKSLTGERARMLEFVRRDFRRAGHALTEAERAEVQRHRTRLVELDVAFNKNLDEYEDGLDLTRDQLDGLDDGYLERLRPGTADGTYRVSLDYPEYFGFMDQATDRDLRRQLQYKFFNKAVVANLPLIEEAVRIRARIAEIFSMPSWAHYAMEEKMAKTPEAVEEMYEAIVPGLTEKSHAELDDLRSVLGDDLQQWDHRYLHTTIRRERYGVDPSAVAAYFPLEPVLEGMFAITGEVFGLTYEEANIPVWHPDVMAYHMLDGESGDQLATFYMDLFPREGKFGHAAAFPLIPAHQRPEGYVLPSTAIAANFTKPGAKTPSLLRHDEVVTLFHEFGHVLHNSLGHTELVRFSGYDTEWDFVEAPSQIMEHWCWNADVLRRFARHYETGEPIPDDLVDRLVEARDLHIALAMLRQVSFGRLDLEFHGPGPEKDLWAITRNTSEISGFPYHEGTFYPAGFGHLFGYDAGYYGYLWAKVFGDDMFSRFEAEGVLSPKVGRDYRDLVLSPGGSKAPMDMLRNFLGREPNQEAFLRLIGIEARSA